MTQKFFFILLFYVLGSTSVFATAFDDANQKFKSGDFAGAALSYEEILTKEGPRVSVFYNLGNSYLQLKKYGPAILAYERARLISPRDSNLLGNLARARKAAVVSENASPYPWLDDTLRFLSRNEYSWLVVVSAFWIGGLALLAGILKFPKGWQRTASYASIAVASVIIAISCVILYLRRAESNSGIIISEKAELRLSPFSKAESVGSIGQGRVVQLGAKNGDFLYAEVPGASLSGWLSNEDVTLIEAETSSKSLATHSSENPK
jgi:tetratricopeptide (TPR) repeat protein